MRTATGRSPVTLGAVGNLTLATATVLLSLLLAPLVASQSKPTSKPQKPDDEAQKQARRWVTFLEIDNRRAEAANALLKMSAKAVPALVQALDDPRPVVAQRVCHILRALGSQAAAAKERLTALSNSKDPQLAYAARWALASFHPQGIILVADSRANRVVEFDKDGKKVLEITNLRNVFVAERLPNGRYLVLLFEEGVKEIDSKGKVYWEYKTSANCATRLPGGNTLICDSRESQVIEIDPNGRVVWKVDCMKPYSAQRLANGNTLIAEVGGRGVVEVSPEGKLVWQGPKIEVPLSAQRLDNGNTLIAAASQRQVCEVDRKNKKIRTLEIKKRPYTAIRLPGGDILVGGKGFLHRYDAKGKQIGQFDVTLARQIHHY